MSEAAEHDRMGAAPSDESDASAGIGGDIASYTIGLALAALLTVVAFVLPTLNLVWPPSIPIALGVLAIAQMGVHLVFFLHLTSGPDNTNNVLALAFGLLVVFLVIGGSVWIIHAMDANMGNPGMKM